MRAPPPPKSVLGHTKRTMSLLNLIPNHASLGFGAVSPNPRSYLVSQAFSLSDTVGWLEWCLGDMLARGPRALSLRPQDPTP